MCSRQAGQRLHSEARACVGWLLVVVLPHWFNSRPALCALGAKASTWGCCMLLSAPGIQKAGTLQPCRRHHSLIDSAGTFAWAEKHAAGICQHLANCDFSAARASLPCKHRSCQIGHRRSLQHRLDGMLWRVSYVTNLVLTVNLHECDAL